jgi:hypothetical protein
LATGVDLLVSPVRFLFTDCSELSVVMTASSDGGTAKWSMERLSNRSVENEFVPVFDAAKCIRAGHSVLLLFGSVREYCHFLVRCQIDEKIRSSRILVCPRGCSLS